MFNLLKNAVNYDNTVTKPNIQGIGDILAIIINVLIGAGFAISLIALAYAFIQYTMSMGDPKKTEQAYHAVLWGVTSAFVTLLALAIKLSIFKAGGVTDPNLINGVPNF